METVREHIVNRLKKNNREVLECARTNKGMRSHSAIVMAALPEKVHMIMVQDREGDMYPLLTLCSEIKNFDFVVRAAKDRKIELKDGTKTGLFEYTGSVEKQTSWQITIGKGPRKKARKVDVDVRFGAVKVLRPHSPVYPRKSVELFFVRVTEAGGLFSLNNSPTHKKKNAPLAYVQEKH